MKTGYYPFFTEGLPTYFLRLREMIRTVIESDLHVVADHTITDYNNLSRLLYVMAGSVPFRPNISKLSERIGLDRNRLVQYIYLLERARMLNLLHSSRKGITALQKPDKIYLENTNLMHALAANSTEIGSERETFVLSHLRSSLLHDTMGRLGVLFPDQGDFLIEGLDDGPVLLEVGGPNKKKGQIKTAQRGIVVRDDIEYGGDGVVPLWMFGFLQVGS